MNKIKIFSSLVLALSVGTCIFSACQKDEPIQQTTDTSASSQTATTEYNGYSYANEFFADETSATTVRITPPLPTKPVRQTEKTSLQSSETKAVITTKKVSSDKVDEISNGINILTKTSPVTKGNNASVMIMGTPHAEYTIEFYETADKKATDSGLGSVKADSNGIASWSFLIGAGCESGERKIIIREKNSDKYIQTSITIL